MFGLYLHIPFCRSKCPYCDFYSVVDAEGARLAAYPAQLQRQLELAASEWRGPLTTIFFGGGTPSLLPARAIGALLEAAARTFDLTPDCEISLEANPGTVTPTQLTELRACGVNRLSLGMQATTDTALTLLGRRHTHADTVAAVDAARCAGFDNLGLDLIFGRPGEGLPELTMELDRLLALEPQHLSCYSLTVEEGTPLAHRQTAGDFQPADEEAMAEQFLYLDESLTAAGFVHYEISNYARPGCACRHNQAYWERRPYLGLGAGAHTFCNNGWGERRAVPADLDRYRAALERGTDPAEMLETFDRTEAMAETLYLGLRTRAGVSEAAFRERFGSGVAEAFPSAVARCGARLRLVDGYWRFDLDGWLVYDHLISHFL